MRISNSLVLNYHFNLVYILGTSGIYSRFSSRINVERSIFYDIGYNAIMTMYQKSWESAEDISITNNVFDGCGISQVCFSNV